MNTSTEETQWVKPQALKERREKLNALKVKIGEWSAGVSCNAPGPVPLAGVVGKVAFQPPLAAAPSGPDLSRARLKDPAELTDAIRAWENKTETCGKDEKTNIIVSVGPNLCWVHQFHEQAVAMRVQIVEK